MTMMTIVPPVPSPTRAEMHAVFTMCRQNQWHSVLNCIRSNHLIPVTHMVMDNHISTTILHQAITSKGDTKARTRVIREILDIAPKAATIKNGYGSLPLHVISQRNTKLDARTKELLINELIAAYKGALITQGGVGKRNPLHIIFTDYISPRLTELMITNGREACFMKDKKGFLPAHVACMRHCSPEKLQMLLDVNPAALYATTNEGETLLSLAVSKATKSHPNYALIEDIKRRLENIGAGKNESARPKALVRSQKPAQTRIISSCKMAAHMAPPTRMTRKRKVTADDDDMEEATLLLHFSRQTTNKEIKLIARV